MSSSTKEFEDLESFIYGSDQPIYGSNSIGTWDRNDLSFFEDFVEEQRNSQFLPTVEGMQENNGLFVETPRTTNDYPLHDLSRMPSIINTDDAFGVRPRPHNHQLFAMGNPYQTGFQGLNDNIYQTENQFARPTSLRQPVSFSIEFEDSSIWYPGRNISQSESQLGENTPIVNNHEPYDFHSAQAVHDFPAVYTDDSLPKREASATLSRRLSEITPEREHAVQNFKRKLSDGDGKPDWKEAKKPKYSRRIANANARYRDALRNSRPEPTRPEGVDNLFQHLKSKIVPKKAYYRKKGANAPASHSSAARTASTTLPETEEENSPSAQNRRIRQTNPRRHIPVEIVRQSAPEGWDRYENDYYSGDDNVSDGEIEIRGKATDYKPPRMACRRCNKFKQPCDHAYPACSLCAKHGVRCRYRDDLTGRQIRPGQLEEVEFALHDAHNEIRNLKEKLKKLEKDQILRDDGRE